MKTLDELVFYCKELEPVGALLLTGEWGCGKTYLIENELREAIKNTDFPLRISLFGVSSIERNPRNGKTSLDECVLQRKRYFCFGRKGKKI